MPTPRITKMELVTPDGKRTPVANGGTVTTAPAALNFEYALADGKCTVIRFGTQAARKEQSAPYWLLGDKLEGGKKVPVFTMLKAGTYPVKIETWSEYEAKGTKGEEFTFTVVVATPAPAPAPAAKPTVESLQKQVMELTAAVSRAEHSRDEAIDSARKLTEQNVVLKKERDAANARATTAEKSATEGQAALVELTKQFTDYKTKAAAELRTANELVAKLKAQGPPAMEVDFGNAKVTKNADGTYRVEAGE
jgi:hypothetical protein